MRKRMHVYTACCLFLLLASAVMAQNVTGTIVGTVTDATGAVVTNSSITVIDEQTNIETKAAASATGEYVVANLPPGTYTVRAELSGFKPSVTRGVRLLANRSSRVDIILEPGAVTQTVEVQASAPVVNSESATIGNVLEANVITTIPLNGRTLDRLIRISAGVTSDSASNPRVAGSAYWGGIQFTVDGAMYNDTGNGGGAYSYRNGLATLPSVDAISEFKIDSNNQKAEFEASVAVTVVSKSGTNDLHGSALWFNRNKEFAARYYYTHAPTPKPAYNRNEFGYTLGGPVYIPGVYNGKNKTFFFHSYEGLRERTAPNYLNSVATQAMRDGDFSGLPALVDPLNGMPFPNNRVPASRIDARSKALIDYVPLPNTAGEGPAGTLRNYRWTIGNISDINRYGVRVDHRFSEKDSIWVHLNHSKGYPYFVAVGYPSGYGNWTNGGYSTQSANLTWNHTLSPRTLNEFRFVYFRHASTRQGMNRDFNPLSLFPGLYPVSFGGLPNMNITNHVAIGDYGGSDPGSELTPQFIDNVTLVRGRHTIKLGADIALHKVLSPPAVAGMGSGLANNSGLGRFDFNGRYTLGGPGTAQPAHAFGDFLLGYPVAAYRSTTSPNLLFTSPRYSFFIQDDWHVSSRLSLSFGLRYMYQSPWGERNDTLSNFDFSSGKLVIQSDKLPSQAQQRLVDAYGIVLASQAGVPVEDLRADKNNFGPRFGFAYRPFGDAKTVVRGGAGVYYNFLPVFIGFRQRGFNNPPFLLAESFEAAAGYTPSISLASPFPGGGAISPNANVTAVEKDIRNSESYQWNLTVEREVRPNLGVRASYVGNHSTHLPWYNYSINLSRTQIPGAIQPNRPYQPWADILLLAGGGNSILHQLQLEAVQRYSSGLSFQAEYSWNRSLDDVPVVGGPQDPYNARADRGNSDQIRRHIFTFAGSYELPFGPGRKFLSAAHPVVKHLAGGWQFSSILYLRTGTPFSPSFTATQTGWRGGRPDRVKDIPLYPEEQTMGQWFNPAAFTTPALYTFGNAARNLLFTPGDIVIDGSILKDFAVYERLKVQFRAEFFNMPNHFNWGGPGSNISVPSTLGRISSGGEARVVQFGLKILF
ncbi:MAG: carboxypeptidase regulatory-like domain-containing protein [Bryobacterales bacterium]|nr:carboxypeptidase regulatory-like domain-containing protein [Bryobacterales bacterium]